MFEHEENAFEEFEEGPPTIMLKLPEGDTLQIHGVRQTPLVVTVSKDTERDPKRDARLLSSALATSLDEATLFHLAEMLFNEFLAPMVGDQIVQITQEQPKKRSSRPKNEHKD